MTNTFVIHNEADNTFWSAHSGWANFLSATRYDAEDAKALTLPLDGVWLDLTSDEGKYAVVRDLLGENDLEHLRTVFRMASDWIEDNCETEEEIEEHWESLGALQDLLPTLSEESTQ